MAGKGGRGGSGARRERGKAARRGAVRPGEDLPFRPPEQRRETCWLNFHSGARTKEIQCKTDQGTRRAVYDRLITGWRAVYQQDDGRSSCLAADEWAACLAGCVLRLVGCPSPPGRFVLAWFHLLQFQNKDFVSVNISSQSMSGNQVKEDDDWLASAW